LAQGLGQKFDKPGLEKVGGIVEQGADLAGGLNAKMAGSILGKMGVPGGNQMGQAVSSLYGGGGGQGQDLMGLMGGQGGQGGQGFMGLAKGFMGLEHGGGIPHNPDLAGAPYKMRGVRLMKSGGINEYGDGGTIDYENGGRPGEIPGFDMTTRKIMRSFDVEGQKPVMDETRQIYIDGVPVSAKQAKAFIEERAEGSEGQGMPSLGDAMMAATSRRLRERSGRDYLGPGMYRQKATEELQAAQKRQGASGLLGALEGYDTSRGTRNYGKGGYLR